MSMVSLGDIPAYHAQRLGKEKIALKYGDEEVTWGELDARSTNRAWALKKAGVQQNDLVTLALPNSVLFYEMTFALWKLGATPHVVSAALPKRELLEIISVSKPCLVIAVAQDLIEGLGAQNANAPLDGLSNDPLPTLIARHWKAMSSGGSTGRPKVILDHAPSEMDPESWRFNMPRDKTIFVPGPLYHNMPFAVSHNALAAGNTVVGMTKFEPEEALRLIVDNQASWVSFVPTMMQRIYRLSPEVRASYDISCLKAVWHMAAPMPPWLKDAWIEWVGPEKIWELYGGTEGQGMTIINGSEWLKHRGSVGRAMGCEMRILDEEGRAVPTGEIGEVFFRPPGGRGSTYHYLGSTSRGNDEGFESIGDFGRLDEEGYLYLADRRTDMVITGGANIFPAEVEAVLTQHPGINDAVVIGLPHEDLGAIVHAIIQTRVDWEGPMDAASMSEFMEQNLVRYKCPRSYEFTQISLRDEAGKVRRSQLREARLNQRAE
jgi:bile acid-coenzyme A ligase